MCLVLARKTGRRLPACRFHLIQQTATCYQHMRGKTHVLARVGCYWLAAGAAGAAGATGAP